MLRRFLPLLLLLLCSCLNAQEVRDFDIKTTENLGRQIFEQDALAWVGTDTLFEQKLDLSKYPSKGWLTEGTRKEGTVTFVGLYEEGYRVMFRVRFKNGKPKFENSKKEELTPAQISEFTARQTAIKALDQPCPGTYNTVVLPDLDGEGYLVYLLTGTTDPDVVPIGGSYRMTLSADGHTIEHKERLSASCLSIPKHTPDRQEVVGLYMSHLVSKRPTEVHIFLNLVHKLPFYVSIPKTGDIWKIENGKMQATQTKQ